MTSRIARYHSKSGAATKQPSKLVAPGSYVSRTQSPQAKQSEQSSPSGGASCDQVSSGSCDQISSGYHSNESSPQPRSRMSHDETGASGDQLSSNIGIKQPSIIVKRATVRNVYVERSFSPTSVMTSSSSSNTSDASMYGCRPKAVTSRAKAPSRHTTFGKHAARERSPHKQRSRWHQQLTLQKRNSLESEATTSSSDYYEDVRLLSIRNNMQKSRNHHNNPLHKPTVVISDVLDTSSETQSESDNYAEFDDVGIPGIRRGVSPSSLETTSCESESDSHNYEEISEYRRPVHNYEEIDEYLPDSDDAVDVTADELTLDDNSEEEDDDKTANIATAEFDHQDSIELTPHGEPFDAKRCDDASEDVNDVLDQLPCGYDPEDSLDTVNDVTSSDDATKQQVMNCVDNYFQRYKIKEGTEQQGLCLIVYPTLIDVVFAFVVAKKGNRIQYDKSGG